MFYIPYIFGAQKPNVHPGLHGLLSRAILFPLPTCTGIPIVDSLQSVISSQSKFTGATSEGNNDFDRYLMITWNHYRVLLYLLGGLYPGRELEQLA
jgi:hypothetical protein